MGFDMLGPVGSMPTFGVQSRDLGYTMMGAATAMGVPGFSMSAPVFPLMAGMNWSSGSSSYFGTPGFRGVADLAWASSGNSQAGYGLSGGLGLYGIGAPAVGSGGYYLGPGPNFLNPMALFSMMYQQTFGQQQAPAQPQYQPAGPAQTAAPQPAAPSSQVAANGNNAAGGGRARGHGGQRPQALNPTEAARLQALDDKKNSRVPLWGGLNAQEQTEYDGLKRRYQGSAGRARPATPPPAPRGGQPVPGHAEPAAPQPTAAPRIPSSVDRTKYHDLKSESGWRALTEAEGQFVANYERDYGTD